MREAKKYPVNLTVKLVLLVEPSEDGTYPSDFEVQDAVREALVDHLDHDILSDSISEGLERKTEGARIDYSEITLHEEQPGDQQDEADGDGPRYWQADWNDEQAEGVRNALSMGELVSIANEDEGIIAYALFGFKDRVTDALNLKEQP